MGSSLPPASITKSTCLAAVDEVLLYECLVNPA